jgi:hypothetical protein
MTEKSTLTDEQVLAFYKELEEHYGDSLANFEHYPRQFANQVLLYSYYKDRSINKEINDKENT